MSKNKTTKTAAKKSTATTKKAPAKKVAGKKAAPKIPSKCAITITDDAKLGVRIGVQFLPTLPMKGDLTPAQNFAISLLEDATEFMGVEAVE